MTSHNPYANVDDDNDDEAAHLTWVAAQPARRQRWFAIGRAAPFLPDGSSRANFEVVQTGEQL